MENRIVMIIWWQMHYPEASIRWLRLWSHRKNYTTPCTIRMLSACFTLWEAKILYCLPGISSKPPLRLKSWILTLKSRCCRHPKTDIRWQSQMSIPGSFCVCLPWSKSYYSYSIVWLICFRFPACPLTSVLIDSSFMFEVLENVFHSNGTASRRKISYNPQSNIQN